MPLLKKIFLKSIKVLVNLLKIYEEKNLTCYLDWVYYYYV